MTVHTSLPLTGERTVPDVVPENYWFRRHEAAYHWVERHFAKLIRDGVVVDAGCGEGYGINVLADNGPATALGLELDELTAAHAKAKYPALTSISRANLDALPLRDDSVDLLVSMQVIEHLWDLPGFLRECFRVTSPSGNCVLTTPNRLTFSPGLQRGQKPTNPFHVEEFDAQQLLELMQSAGFTDVAVLGLRHGTRLTNWESVHGSVIDAQVYAALTDSPWSPELAEIVASVDCGDFLIDPADVDTSGDLLVIAKATGEC